MGRQAFDRMKDNKAPGLDGVPAKFFKKATKGYLKEMLALLNYVFKNACTPQVF